MIRPARGMKPTLVVIRLPSCAPVDPKPRRESLQMMAGSTEISATRWSKAGAKKHEEKKEARDGKKKGQGVNSVL